MTGAGAAGYVSVPSWMVAAGVTVSAAPSGRAYPVVHSVRTEGLMPKTRTAKLYAAGGYQ